MNLLHQSIEVDSSCFFFSFLIDYLANNIFEGASLIISNIQVFMK